MFNIINFIKGLFIIEEPKSFRNLLVERLEGVVSSDEIDEILAEIDKIDVPMNDLAKII